MQFYAGAFRIKWSWCTNFRSSILSSLENLNSSFKFRSNTFRYSSGHVAILDVATKRKVLPCGESKPVVVQQVAGLVTDSRLTLY
jgi:hypothetical protein